MQFRNDRNFSAGHLFAIITSKISHISIMAVHVHLLLTNLISITRIEWIIIGLVIVGDGIKDKRFIVRNS